MADETIHEAAENGHAEQVERWLHQNPALLEAKDPEGWTPLFAAIFGGWFEAVRLLLSRGADVNSRDERG